MLAEQQVDRREVVPKVGGGHELLLQADPALLVGHVPVELPQAASCPQHSAIIININHKLLSFLLLINLSLMKQSLTYNTRM